ncbi:MAG: hypothetical protein DCC73_14265 [Proteobacteria bacterium]|nr:MAG: hypothetical protein DCC73_14265 [Pseudomonadota bacterium]
MVMTVGMGSNPTILDSQTAALLASVAASGNPPLYEQSVDEARQGLAAFSLAMAPPSRPVARVEDGSIPGGGGSLSVRIYWPIAKATRDKPATLLYFHGGGFALGDLDTHDAICRHLCDDGYAVVISVDYRRPPEHKFPAAVEDCYAALCWAAEETDILGGDRHRLIVAGDSAGGNLAAVMALMARDRHGPKIALQILIYPVTDMDPAYETPSRRDFGGGDYFLSIKDMVWLAELYAVTRTDLATPYMSPRRAASHANLPPAIILTAGCDPLCDEGKDYADRLQAASVPVTYKCYEHTIHGFISFAGGIDAGKDALAFLSKRVRSDRNL